MLPDRINNRYSVRKPEEGGATIDCMNHGCSLSSSCPRLTVTDRAAFHCFLSKNSAFIYVLTSWPFALINYSKANVRRDRWSAVISWAESDKFLFLLISSERSARSSFSCCVYGLYFVTQLLRVLCSAVCAGHSRATFVVIMISNTSVWMI